MKELPELLMEMLKGKEHILKTILTDIQTCQKTSAGCSKVDDNWDTISGNPEDLKKQLRTAIRTNKRLADILQRVIVLQVAYVAGSNFDTDLTMALQKVGKGDEAIRQMFKNKLKGN